MRPLVLAVALVAACSDDPRDCAGDAQCLAPRAHSLYVASEGSVTSYDIATRAPRPGSLQEISTPVDLQALDDGTLLVNLTTRDEVCVIDGDTMLERARVRSSARAGARPVHSFISPDRRLWMTLNDGAAGDPATNTAIFVDIAAGSATRFQRVGEVTLGVGHHKAAFSSTRPRVVISNIGDCANVLSVYDYGDLASIGTLATLTAAVAGWTAADPGEGNFHPRFCDATFRRGTPPAPHGCATSKLSGKVYCNLTSSGDMVVVDVDAATPTFTLVPTGGKGGGFTFAHPDGRHLYTMQEEPREGVGGAPCQIGQLAVTDATTDAVVAELPLFYRGPSCTTALAGTPAATANPGHAHFAAAGRTLFIPTSGGFGVADARVDQLLVVDTADPARPTQAASIAVGRHTSHSASALSGDGQWLFVVHTIDGTVSQIDTAGRAVVATFDVGPNPKTVATFGDDEGPSEQTGPLP